MTDHLVLRPLDLGDVPVFAAWGSDRRFCEVAGWRLDRPLAGHENHWRTLVLNPEPDHLRLAAVVAGDPVGYLDLAGVEPTWRELGYVVGPSSRWGQGLGGMVAQLGVDYGFNNLGLQEIRAEALDANRPSIRILKSIGMTETGPGEDDTFLGEASFYRRFRITRDAS